MDSFIIKFSDKNGIFDFSLDAFDYECATKRANKLAVANNWKVEQVLYK